MIKGTNTQVRKVSIGGNVTYTMERGDLLYEHTLSHVDHWSVSVISRPFDLPERLAKISWDSKTGYKSSVKKNEDGSYTALYKCPDPTYPQYLLFSVSSLAPCIMEMALFDDWGDTPCCPVRRFAMDSAINYGTYAELYETLVHLISDERRE